MNKPTPTSSKAPTIVTAFFDINRENFSSHPRSSKKYFDEFKFWARLKNNLVVYTEKKFQDDIQKIRTNFGLAEKTTIIVIDDIFSIESEVFDRMTCVSKNPDFSGSRYYANALSNKASYDYIMLMKYYCLSNAVKTLKLHGQVAWVDFGFNHGGEVFTNPKEFDTTWHTNLSSDKIHLFALNEKYQQPIFNIVLHQVDSIMGAPVICPARLCDQLYALTLRSMNSLLDVDLIDDDQALLMMAAKIAPHHFEIHKSSWFLPIKEYGLPHLTVKTSGQNARILTRIANKAKIGHQNKDYIKRTKQQITTKR